MRTNQPNNPHVVRAKLLRASFFVAALAAFFVISSCSTPTTGKGTPGFDATAKVPLASDIRTGVLPNGLRYFIRQNAKPEGRAFLQLYVDAGSVLEQEKERGVAHFVEHMAFNGTEHFPKNSLVEYLRSLGMQFGADINAYTSFDETVYGINVPTQADTQGAEKGLPDQALAVLNDWTQALSFDPKEVDSERSVVYEEYRLGLGAQDRIRRVLLPSILKGSIYAERLPIGLPEVIKTATPDTLRNFYKTWYRPDNMALVIVGDFDAAKVEQSLASRFTAPAPTTPLVRPRPELPPPTRGARTVTVATDPELSYGIVRLFYKRAPKAIPADLGTYRESLILNLINRMLDQRFQDATNLPETPYADAGSGEDRYGRTSRFYVLSAVPKPESTRATLEALLKEKESILRFGFTPSEIDRAKKGILSDLTSFANEADRRSSEDLAQEVGAYYLRNIPAPDPAWELRTITDLLPGIDQKTLAAATADLFSPDDLTVTIIANDKEASTLPDEATVKTMVAAAAKMKLEPPKDESVDAGLISVEPQPGAVTTESSDQVTGTVTWQLSNGAKVILKPTKNQNDQIILTSLALGGKSDVPVADAVSADLATDLVSASGLGPFSATELSKKLAGKQAALDFTTGYYARSFSGSSTVGDFQTLMELLYLYFTEPRIDETAVKAYLDNTRTGLLRKEDNPDSVFSETASWTLTGKDPRFEPLTAERLSLLNLDTARKFLRAELNPGDFTFVLAGNVDPQTARPLVERYLASIPGKRTGATWTDPGFRRPDSADVIVRKGAEAKAKAFIARYTPSPYSLENETLADLLQEYLSIRYLDELREKRGDVYNVSVTVSQMRMPWEELYLGIDFATGPEKLDDAEKAAEAELVSLRDQGPDPEVLKKAKETLKKRFQTSLEDNQFIASSLRNLDVLGLPLSRYLELPQLYDKLGAEDLKGAAARFLKAGTIKVTLLPQK